MTKEGLKFISDALSAIGINYQLLEWTSATIPTTYFVGEYQEQSVSAESGMEITNFILTGTTRGAWLDLENSKHEIKNQFNSLTAILPNGAGIAVNYLSALPVPTGTAELKRIQINLTIKEWRVE